MKGSNPKELLKETLKYVGEEGLLEKFEQMKVDSEELRKATLNLVSHEKLLGEKKQEFEKISEQLKSFQSLERQGKELAVAK